MTTPKMPLTELVARCEGPRTGLRGFFGASRGDWTGSDFFDALRYYGPTAANPRVSAYYKQLVELEADLQSSAKSDPDARAR